MSFPEQPLGSFLDDLASSKPAPGGGSVAALAGALGAALVSMVGSLTVGKEKFKDVEPEVQALMAKSEALRHRLLAYIDEDVAAFNGYSAAANLPKDTAEQKAARSAAIQKALMNAVDPPMNTARACVDVLDLCLPIAEKGNVQAVSDAGVGALMAEAGLARRGAERAHQPGLDQGRRVRGAQAHGARRSDAGPGRAEGKDSQDSSRASCKQSLRREQ